MNNLGNSYSDLGRHKEALEMRGKTLEFRYRVLPENHPDIGEVGAFPVVLFLYFYLIFAGTSLYNISCSHKQAGDLQRAMEYVLESLRVWQTALPPGHQDILDAEDMIRDLERAMQEGDVDEDVAQEDVREVEEILKCGSVE